MCRIRVAVAIGQLLQLELVPNVSPGEKMKQLQQLREAQLLLPQLSSTSSLSAQPLDDKRDLKSQQGQSPNDPIETRLQRSESGFMVSNSPFFTHLESSSKHDQLHE